MNAPVGKLKFTNPLAQSSASTPVKPEGYDPIFGRPANEYVGRTTFSRSTLKPNNYVMNVAKLSKFTWFLRGFNLPGLSGAQVYQQTPWVDVPHPGDKIIFNPLVLRMALAEDLSNYMQIQRWMRGIYGVEGPDQAEALEVAKAMDPVRWARVSSDISISLTRASSGSEFATFEYINAFPMVLEDIDDIGPDAEGDANEVHFTCTFMYAYYRIKGMPDVGYGSQTPE